MAQREYVIEILDPWMRKWKPFRVFKDYVRACCWMAINLDRNVRMKDDDNGCPCGVDHSLWRDSSSRDRPGWILTECKKCGKFIGYRPVDQGKSSEK